jgi:hypothetical protein
MRRVGHAGGDFGYRAQLVQYYSRDPGQYLAIATLCNGRTINAQNLTRRVAEILLGSEALAPAVASGAPLAPAVSVGEAELAALAGIYRNPSDGAVLRLIIKDGNLIPDGASVAYVPIGAGRFRVGELRIEALFPPPGLGEAQELHMLRPSARPLVFSRVTAVSYSAAELQAFTGQYRSDELDTTYTLTVTPEGGLTVLREKVEPVLLTAVTRDIFVGQSLGSSVTFVRAPAGEVKGLTITGETPRSLTFTRVNAAPSSVE